MNWMEVEKQTISGYSFYLHFENSESPWYALSARFIFGIF
jgi:hypothetical protein